MNTRLLVQCGLVSALIAVTACISLPFAVPFTMQTFGVFSALLILGGKYGTLSILIYVFLGIIGLPVFAGFKGGINVLLSPLGGFIISFILMGLIYSFVTHKFGTKPNVQLAGLIIGLAVCYFSGTMWYMLFCKTDFMTSLSACVLPFIIPDAIKIHLSFALVNQLRKLRIVP